MRILVTGGSGVLGRALLPRLHEAGHEVAAPGRQELDLFSPVALGEAVHGCDAVFHLATRIPAASTMAQPGAWAENDRLRTVATRLLVDAAIAAGVGTFVLPGITFIYPAAVHADEDTPVGDDSGRLRSILDAEAEVRRFGAAGGRGIVLRLGLLWGPGTGSVEPSPRYGATLHIEDAGEALLLALDLRSGVYNVVADGERVVNARFKAATGWQPRH